MSIQNFFNQTGTLKTRVGYDQYGKEIEAIGTTIYCRLENKVRTRLKPDGSVEEVDGKVFIDPSTVLKQGDHMVIGDIDYRIMNLNNVIDGRGLSHHWEADVQKWAT